MVVYTRFAVRRHLSRLQGTQPSLTLPARFIGEKPSRKRERRFFLCRYFRRPGGPALPGLRRESFRAMGAARGSNLRDEALARTLIKQHAGDTCVIRSKRCCEETAGRD